MESENAKLEHEIKNASKRLRELTSRIKETKLEITSLNKKLEQWWADEEKIYVFRWVIHVLGNTVNNAWLVQ